MEELSEAIGQVVERYRRTFPWYADMTHGLLRANQERLEELPILDERVLTRHYYTAEATQFGDGLIYHTSGTASGKTKRILYSRADHESYIAHRKEVFAEFLSDISADAVAVADLGTGHAAASARTIFEEMGFAARDINFTRPIEEHVECLNRWQPAVLFTMPMILDRLMYAPLGLRIKPKKIIVVGDLAPENWRRHIAQAFEVRFEDVLDVYGSIEIGAIAFYNATTGLYHFHDHIVPESIPVRSAISMRPIEAPDECGALLLTSLAREYFPAVRYATNDVVRGLRCVRWKGKPTFVFDRLEGRCAGGEFKHGERLSQYDITSAINRVFPGALFEIVNDGGLEIRLVADEITASQRKELIDALMANSPSVAQMVKSGLVDEVKVSSAALSELRRTPAKRALNIKEN